MTTSLITLPNGLRTVVLRKEGPPLVTIGVAYQVGSAQESPHQTGYAHLFEHLMFDNVERADGRSFDELVTTAGGTSNAYTTYDWTYYHMTLPLQAVELGLELEAARMRDFVISEATLRTQCKVVIEEIAENVFNQPYGTARQLLAQTAFEAGSCYSWDIYGSIEHLQRMSLEDAHQWYERFYRPDNAVLAVVGGFESTTTIVELIFSHFAGIARPAIPAINECQYCPAEKSHLERDSSLPADMVISAYHFPGIGNDTASVAAIFLSALLSAGRASPLARQFIHDKPLAHHASTDADIRQRGSLFLFSALARDKTIRSEQLLEQWQQIIATLPTLIRDETHRERARNKMRRRFAQSFQTTEGLAEMLALAVLLYGDPDRPWKELNMLLSVSVDELIAFAEQFLQQPPAIVQYSTTG